MNTLAPLLLALTLGGGADWKTFTPKGAGFTVSMPAAAEETRQSVKSPQGAIAIRIFTSAAKDGTFVVGVTEHPEPIPAGQEQARLDQARDGAVRQTKGRLRSETKITVDSRPGREFVVATEAGQSYKIRLIADRNRLFQVMVVGGARWLDSPDATRFLESFRLAK